ncbi:unnamed protein product, partial [Cuscuta epithymum]
MTDPTSTYYLGSGDQPGNLITHVIFKGDNYLAWSRAIALSLKARRKYGFVDGTIKKPTEAAQLNNWETVNSMIISWMLRSMELSVAGSIPFHDEARSLWVYMENRFSVANGPRLQQLRASITDCRQSKTMTVDAYYTTLMGFYDELNRLKPLHACTCGQCTCGVAAKFAADREEEQLHQFLIGIDDEVYGTVRSNLLSHTPLPDLNRAYQAFLQEENSRAIARGKSVAVDTHAFALQVDRQNKGRLDRNEREKITCAHCKKKGHDIGSCFKLHGYPEWWKERNRANGANGVTASRGGGVKTHAVASSLVTPGSGAPSQAEANGLNELSKEQVQALLNLINAETRSCDRMSGEYNSFDWIIDTGASHLVTGNITYLTDRTHIRARQVGLPDERIVAAILEGRVPLSKNFILDHVLYVPGLNCHLISVSQLIDESDCLITFTDSFCAIQDRHSRNLIGAGERRDGIYYFRRVPTLHVVHTSALTEFELWHRRLGHPSDRVVKLLPAVSGSSSKNRLNKTCEVCPQAKQACDSFPISSNKASRILELIHCDLWGPYKTPSTCDAIYFMTLVDDYSRAVWIYLLRDKKEV